MCLRTDTAEAAVCIWPDCLTALKTQGCFCVRSIMRQENRKSFINGLPGIQTVEVHAYPEAGKYAVLNNTSDMQKTIVYDGEGRKEEYSLKPGEIVWKDILR